LHRGITKTGALTLLALEKIDRASSGRACAKIRARRFL